MKRGKLGKNLISNLVYFVLNIFVSLWLVSYLVRELGVAAYGLVPLATTIASYFNVITAGLNAAVGRYMTVAMSKGQPSEVSRIFNSSLFASGVVSVAMCVLSIPLIGDLSNLINVPAGIEREAGWLFFLVVMGLAVTTFGTPFQTVLYGHNRFDLQNFGNIFGLTVRVLVVIALFYFIRPELWLVGLSVLFGALATFGSIVWASHRLAPEIRICRKDYAWSIVKNVSGTGGWVFVSQVGTLLLINIDLLVANMVVGATEAGKYALILQWSLLMRNLAMTVSGVFGPTMIRLHAEGKCEELVEYSRRAVRAVGLGMTIPIGIVCGLSDRILSVWLGPEFSELAPLMILATLHLSLNLAYMPLHSISMATNKVKVPGVVQILAGFVNLGLAVILAKLFGLYGIAIAGGVVLLLRNMIFTPIYSAKILGQPSFIFVRDAVPVLIMVAVVFLFSWLGAAVFPPGSWIALAAFSGVAFVFASGVAWLVFLNDSEKRFFLDSIDKIRK